ncbi:MAG TPA: molecular chaperone, partial [Roseburia sp.]|nr:molecular chaperone [Roseburia sp.]
MEDNRREEKEALKVLTEYSPKLLKSMRNVMEELHGNRQPDTDE